jgi:hypothetical protein
LRQRAAADQQKQEKYQQYVSPQRLSTSEQACIPQSIPGSKGSLQMISTGLDTDPNWLSKSIQAALPCAIFHDVIVFERTPQVE